MANKNFVVKNGLTVGDLTISAESGNVTTVGSIVSTGIYTDSYFYANGLPFIGGGGSGDGYTGSQGFTGSQGIPGEAAAIGYTGSQGLNGDSGYTGSQGSQGEPGIATSSLVADLFEGDGTTTTFALSVSPTGINQTLVVIDGVTQIRDTYSLLGSNLTFTEAPVNGAKIEITTFVYGTASFVNRSYVGDGVTDTYTVTNGVTAESIVVTDNGIVQRPAVDYTVSGPTVIFSTAPSDGSIIGIREIPAGIIGYTGSAGPVTEIQGYSSSSGGAGIEGNLYIDGTLTVNNSILPTVSNVIDIGSPTQRFGTLYLAGNTIDLGGALIKSLEGEVSFETATGNIDLNANLIEFLSSVSVEGPAGAVGFTGSQGDIGLTGSQGIAGFTGSQGDQGVAGFTGSQGDIGLTGSQGIAGFTGSQGDQGSIGFTGSRGEDGVIGYNGSTGYTGSAGTLGFTGSQGAVKVNVSPAPPVEADIGDVWIDSNNGIQYFYIDDGDSFQWVELSNPGTTGFTGSGGGGGVSTAASVGYSLVFGL